VRIAQTKGPWAASREKKTKVGAAATDKPIAYDEVFAKIQVRSCGVAGIRTRLRR
jgi:hypothetical protein